jgi:hypothetical protein
MTTARLIAMACENALSSSKKHRTDVARVLGVSSQRVDRMLDGENEPPLRCVMAIAKLCGDAGIALLDEVMRIHGVAACAVKVDAEPAPLPMAQADVAIQSGELALAIAKALADGTIDERDRQLIHRERGDVIRAASSITA